MSVYLGNKKVGVTIEKSKPDMLQARVDGDNSCRYLFYNYNGTELDISRLDTSNVTSMAHMFDGCTKLETITHNFNTDNVISMDTMFDDCNRLTSLDVSNFNTSNVTTMNQMFYNCNALTKLDVSNFNTSNVTTMRNMFYGCGALNELDLSNFNTSNVTNMSSMFLRCSSLTSLDVSKFDTSKVTNMTSMFSNCGKLESLDLSSFDTSNVTNMSSMFNFVPVKILDLSSFDTSKVTNMSNMLYSSEATEVLGKINMISATNVGGMLLYTSELTKINLYNIKLTLQLGSGTTWGHLLSMDSLLNTIKELWNMTDSTSKTLTVGTANLEKLANVYVKLVPITDEMRAEDEYIDNKLPFEVCEITDEGAMTINEYVTSKNWALA